MKSPTLLFLFLVILACQHQKKMPESTAPEPTSKWPYGITYEIFVQSWYDTNGDSLGDLNGVTAKLDYLADLGVDAIWLMPINPSPSYHKYDVTDYYGIHPDYGTLEDFKNLVNEAHKRDIKIVMDLVINHCSSLHPWFASALEPQSEYRDFFVWATPEEIEAEGTLIKAKTGDSDNIHQWNEVPGQDELYFGFFWSGMPDLNYDNPKVREEVYKIGNYWLNEIGVDGFRLDAAKHIFPDHRAEDNHAFWQEFKEVMESYKSDVYLVGEVWADLPTQAPFAKGFSALFNFDMAFSILETVKNEQIVRASIHEHAWKVDKEGSLIDLYNESEDLFQTFNPDFVNTTFLTNHDQNRAMSFLENDQEKAKLAASILFTLPGSPYIYYGEELGMRGMKPDELIREPFLWETTKDSGEPTWMTPEYNTRKTVKPLPVQMADSSSIYQHYKQIIGYRKNSPALTYGSVRELDMNDRGVLAYYREHEGESLLVIHNLTGQPQEMERLVGFTKLIFTTATEIVQLNNVLVIPAYSTIILTKPQ